MSFKTKGLQARGGKRPGSGRPKGSGKGRVAKSGSITLIPELWAKLDAIKGGKTRSGWIAAKVRNAKSPKP